jgi:site-specific DNA recombinase
VTSDGETPRRAAIYARLSRDKKGGGVNVARQEADCRDLAARLHPPVEIVAVHSDNDITAFKGTRRSKPRPGYEELLDDLRSGRVDAVIAWHTDRLHCDLPELEEYISVCGEGSDGVPTYTVRGGDLHLDTASGRMVARILGTVARQEVEHMIERQKDHKEGVRRDGGRVGGVRPFGYILDPVTKDTTGGKGLIPEPTEAAAIRDAYTKVLAGGSTMAIAREWNAAGLRTPRKTADPAKTGRGYGGSPWKINTVKQVLVRAQNAALIEYKGEIIGPANWDPIVSEDTWRAVKAILDDPARRTTPGPKPRHLLTGLLICGVCGGTAFGVVHNRDRFYYKCQQGSWGTPGMAAVAGHPPFRRRDLLDEYVETVIIERLSRPDVQAALNTRPEVDIAALDARRTEINAELEEWARAPGITPRQLQIKNEPLLAELHDVEQQMSEALRGDPLPEFTGNDPAKVWAELKAAGNIERMRAIARLLLRVRINPATTGPKKGLDYESVEILPPDVTPAPRPDLVQALREQREELAERERQIAGIFRADPEISDTAAAKMVNPPVAHKTAGAVRRRLQAAGEIPVRLAVPGQRDMTLHRKLVAILREDPWLSDSAVGRAAGVHASTAGKVRGELEAAGEIPVIRRRGRGAPVNLGYQPRSQ